jgi:glycosyltransferase involved in cell wall biosynthesis
MKLLLVTTVFPSPLEPQRGVFNREMVRAFGAGHEVRVIAPVAWPVAWRARRDGRAWDDSRRLDGVDVRHPVYFYTPRTLRTWYGTFFQWSIRRSVDSVLASFSPDVVVGYWAHPDGQAAVAIARRLGVPAVVMVGGSDILVLGETAGRGRRIRRVLDAADAIVTVSEDLKRTMLRWSVPPSKVHVVQRGVDVTRFTPGSRDQARERLSLPHRDPLLLWVGHMVPVKGLDVLLQACASAAAAAAFHLYLVGDGPLRAALQRRCGELGLLDRVTFVGAVTHATLPDWYRAADWTVMSSRSEGIPNVLRESIASGTPFIAPRIGGIAEIADPLVDRLVPPNDPAALGDAIVRSVRTTSPLVRRLRPVSLGDAAQQLLGVLESTARAQRRPAAAGPVPAVQSAGVRS